MEKEVVVYNDEQIVYEGSLEKFLELNSEDKEFILSQIDLNKEISEFNEVSGAWKIIIKK